jgi:ribosomal protein S12 methylthiotransferase
MALQRKISRARNKQLIGKELPVLVEGPSQETDLLWQARLATQAPEIDGVCYINDFGPGAARPGEIRTLRITEAHDYDLVGELVDEPEHAYLAQAAAAGPGNPFRILGSSPAKPVAVAPALSPASRQ